LSDECPEHGNEAPHASQGVPVGLALYVHDVDAAFDKAVEAGASVKEPVEDKFWGDRAGTVTDPFGHKWTLLTHVEEVSAEEIKKRMHEACAETAGKA
jgi:PhnB protein